jgi:hypothetical protein
MYLTENPNGKVVTYIDYDDNIAFLYYFVI